MEVNAEAALKLEMLERYVDDLFGTNPLSFGEFMECFAEVEETQRPEIREEMFKLYAQLFYVVQRNTKDEIREQLVPRHNLEIVFGLGSEGGFGGGEQTSVLEANTMECNAEVLRGLKQSVEKLRADVQQLRNENAAVDAEIDGLRKELAEAMKMLQ